MAGTGGTVLAVSVGHVEAPDGTLAAVDGAFHADIVETDGAATRFEYPVAAERVADRLSVAGANRVATELDLWNVSHVEIRQLDPVGTMVLIGVLSLAGALLTAGLAIVLTRDDQTVR